MENVPKQDKIPWATSKTYINPPPAKENASEFTRSLGKKLRLQKYTNKTILHRSSINFFLSLKYSTYYVSNTILSIYPHSVSQLK
jgi:hypothetical protein